MKEIVKCQKDDFDYNSMSNKKDKFKLNKETYSFCSKERVNGDGEWWRIVVQRKSDKKYFEYRWGYGHDSGNYYFDPNLSEVFQKIETKTIEIITYN